MDEIVATSEPTDLKILIIGIDGVAFKTMNKLMADGHLPTMQKLVENGASGILKSELPMISPAIWTTIATGRSRQIHGISHFWQIKDRTPKDRVLVSSNSRRVAAIWNWASAFGKRVGFIGWWASWPAEPVNGWIITDRVARTRFTEWSDSERAVHLTYPGSLADKVRPLLVDPDDPPMEEVARLVQLTSEELHEFKTIKKPLIAHGLSVFKFAYAAQRSNENIALNLVKKGQPDLMGVYLVAADPISHTFWHYFEPNRFRGVDSKKAARLGELIPGIYKHNDIYIEKLLNNVDLSRTVVLIVSDHGMKASGKLPVDVNAGTFEELQKEAVSLGRITVGQTGVHHEDGVFIVCGPSIKKGFKGQAGVLDIAPTILTLMGLPVSKKMEGRVLEEIIEPRFLAKHPTRKIDSIEKYYFRRPIRVDQRREDKELVDQLRALGYVK
ncbi:MAG: hypothetical protein GY854_25855 [Deltaproteobacteria bacterium]|nr:hypothetical protein [Deltaproteobacteria bacterium]